MRRLLLLAACGLLVVGLAACDLEGSGPNATLQQAISSNYHRMDTAPFQGVGGFKAKSDGSNYGTDFTDQWIIATGPNISAGKHTFGMQLAAGSPAVVVSVDGQGSQVLVVDCTGQTTSCVGSMSIDMVPNRNYAVVFTNATGRAKGYAFQIS